MIFYFSLLYLFFKRVLSQNSDIWVQSLLCDSLDQEGKTADYNGNGFIEFSELIKFVQKFVDDFSDGQQTPWLSHKEMFGDIPLAVVKN